MACETVAPILSEEPYFAELLKSKVLNDAI